MPTIVIRHPDGSTEEREVVGKLTVGCDEENDLVLRAGGVAQRHAQFFAEGGELVLENLGSAAATIVDGETLASPRRLKPGVRVLIGEYEVSLKPNRVSVRKLGPVALPDATLTEEASLAPRPASDRPPVLAAAVALLGVLAVVVLAAALLPSGKPAVEELPIPPPPQPCAELEPQRKLAREEPSERALAAANAVLECDPLDPEVLSLKRQLERELKGSSAAERGLRLVELGRDEQALDALREIPDSTRAFIASRPIAIEAAGRVRRESARACLAYSREKKSLQAQPMCERAMEIACQELGPDELLRSKDPVLLALLKARTANDPSGPRWKCPSFALIRPLATATDPAKAMRAAIAARVADPQMAAAVVLYAEGKLNEAIVQLQIVKEKSSKAPVHALAESLRKDMANVDSLKKIGDGMLQKGELEKAAKTYREALELDARLMPEVERTPSVTRRSIQSELAQAALRIGTPLARRPDRPRACAAFRTGFSFFRGNTELNEALASECSGPAKQLLDGASGCADLNRALELAVPGDGIAEEIAARKPQLDCR